MTLEQKQARGRTLIIAAPHSGSGKTMVTLGLLRAFKNLDVSVVSAKVGPDYIDPAFHAAASARPCVNLDPWAMPETLLRTLARTADGDLQIIEGVMGLFDGADTGFGSTADLAALLHVPVILVVDARAQAQSVAALLHGFQTFRGDVEIAGVIFNRVGSARHERILRNAAQLIDIPVLGALPRDDRLHVPSRHLGLKQAGEQASLEAFLNDAGRLVADHVDLDLPAEIARIPQTDEADMAGLGPLGQNIAIAKDEAFGFAYAHLLAAWRAAGATLHFFSPLGNEAPARGCDAVFLPGGYPELHAGKIAANTAFLTGLKTAASDALIYGECGGYMVLGDALIDADGTTHEMAGLLPVTTSFETRTRHLGYRALTHDSPLPWAPTLRGHEFHYSTLVTAPAKNALFQATTSDGISCPPMGCVVGRVMGSYAHVIASAEQAQ